MSARSKHIVTLALNKELARKVAHSAEVHHQKRIKQRSERSENADPDFIVVEEQVSTCSSDSGNSNSDFEVEKENIAPMLVTDSRSGIDKNMVNNNTEYEFLKTLLEQIILNATELSEKKNKKKYTKHGTLRKRKIYEETPTQRKKQKMEKIVESHKVKDPCTEACPLKCADKISFERRREINRQYWNLGKEEKKCFLSKCIKKEVKKRCTSVYSRRENTFKYFLKDARDMEQHVCKTFLLSVMGYTKNNDRILKTVRYSTIDGEIIPKQDQRGRHPSNKKVERDPIIQHIYSFRPCTSHYRREHAPKRLYLPSDVSVAIMFKDFIEKYPNIKISYELYRKEVANLNISFARLGNEECFECTRFNLHFDTTKHDKDNLPPDCTECLQWKNHKARYTSARNEYRKDEGQVKNGNVLYISVDLEKVIMLPRAEMYKEVLFVPRIICFNQSFVPLGKSKIHDLKPLAVIWNESVAGRKKEDIISAFYAFFLKNKSKEKIVIWLDNCSAQNKNWAIFSFFIYIVNCSEVALIELELKYLIPGHTFMSADSFHHQVELSLKHKKKVWDFEQFKDAVEASNSSWVNVLDMKLDNFFDWKDLSSKYKLQKTEPRAYLHDMCNIIFTRGEKTLKYKKSFTNEENYLFLNFLTAKSFKDPIPKPSARNVFRGVDANRKDTLLKKLRPIIPQHCIQFWENLPINNRTENDESDSE